MSNDTDKKQLYFDNKDFFAEFMFNPDIQDEADFGHMDKNLAITKLSSRFNEPERARSLLEALHVLNNIKYFYAANESILVGFRTEQRILQSCTVCNKKFLNEEKIFSCTVCKEKSLTSGELVDKKISVYEDKKVLKSYYPKTYHTLKAKFRALVTTAMARDGHLIRAAQTQRFEREDSIEDRTESKQKFWGGKDKSSNRENY